MKTLIKHRLTLTLFFALSSLLLPVGTAFSLPYMELGDPVGPNGWAPRLRAGGFNVGSVDYVSDIPNGHTGLDRGLGIRITYQYALPNIAAGPYVGPLPLVMVFHGNGGNSGSLCRSWIDHNGISIIERRNDPGNEFILVAIDGHPTIDNPIDDKSGNWHYHYSEYNFDVPDDGLPSTDVHRVDHVQGVENVIARLVSDPAINIDSSRIYITGFSGGGLMTHFLAMEGIGTYEFAASATIDAALGGIKNIETTDPLNTTWSLVDGGFQLGTTALTYSDCNAAPDCTPIPASELIYPLDDGVTLPTLIQLGDSDPHFPVNGGEDLDRFIIAVLDPARNYNRTGVSTLTQTTRGYRLKNSTTNHVSDCPLISTNNLTNGAGGFIMSEYNDNGTGCNAVIKVVEMENWGHAIGKPVTLSTYDSLERSLQFFDAYGIDPVGGSGGGLGQ